MTINRNSLGRSEYIDPEIFLAGVIDYSGCGTPTQQFELMENDYVNAWINGFWTHWAREFDWPYSEYMSQIFDRVENYPSGFHTADILLILRLLAK